MEVFILPVSKNPAFGRVAPARFQDWFRSCVKAVALEQKLIGDGCRVAILVLSNVHVRGFKKEGDFYVEALRSLGARNVRELRSTYETIGEIDTARRLAEEGKAELIVISTFGHYFRVWWLISGSGIKHLVAFGVPRFRELLTDLVMTFLFPLIDIAGKRTWFQEKVVARRKAGKH